jgi:hypothetical protein
MQNKTKELLIRASQVEIGIGDPALGVFLQRLANDKPSILATVEGGILDSLIGFPGKWRIIDFDVLEGVETDEEIYDSVSDIILDPEQYTPREALEKAVEVFNGVKATEVVPLLNIPLENKTLTIVIPTRDYNMIKHSLKRSVPPTDMDLIGRNYSAYSDGVTFDVSLTSANRLNWRVHDKDGFVTSVFSNNLSPFLHKNGRCLYTVVFMPDPTYE